MGARRDRLDGRLAKAMKTRRQNSPLKTKERSRRAANMIALIKRSEPPYTPAVMSWLSRQLGKPAKKITPQDIETITT